LARLLRRGFPGEGERDPLRRLRPAVLPRVETRYQHVLHLDRGGFAVGAGILDFGGGEMPPVRHRGGQGGRGFVHRLGDGHGCARAPASRAGARSVARRLHVQIPA
jgi:hypothetical protein